MTIIVNLYGGPGCGKSTMAAEIFTQLKKQNIETELVSEFAKDLIVQFGNDALSHQFYVTGNQAYRIWAAAQRMEVVVVDSPILLGPVYDQRNSIPFKELCLEYHNEFTNINLWLPRRHNHHLMNSRVHSLTQSISLDNRIHRLLEEMKVDLIDLSEVSLDQVINTIISYVRK
jgi:nicotinamide riboside kinase